MKKIYILSCLLFLLFKSNAQNAPCNFKKSDWQTAVTNKDGSIEYQVEESTCNGSEICGEPKIILKHSFSKPAWFIIRLRGVDCSGRTLESEFHTGSKSIQPDVAFVSAKNWHMFKEVLKVVHVEVSYEKITEEVFRFDEKEEEIKAAQAKKLEEEKRLAEEQSKAKKEAAVANNTKKTTPPKTNNAKQSPPAKQPAPPSVKKETKATPPKNNDAVTQRPAEKPKTQPAKKVETPSVKKETEANKPKPNDAVTQRPSEEPKTEPANKEPETEKVKEEKAAEVPVKNDVVQEPEKVVATPNSEEKRTVEPRAEEKPAEQPAKKAESAMAKYENNENTAPNTVTPQPEVKKEESIPIEEPKVEKTKKSKSKSNMRDSSTVVDTLMVNRLNVVKTNLLYPLALGYERHIIANSSILVNGFYFPGISYGSKNGKIGYLELTDASKGFSAEIRYYFSKNKPKLTGFYGGGFYSVRTANAEIQKVFTSTNETIDATVTVPTGFGITGLMVGLQKIRTKGFTMDLSLGLGYYEAFNIPVIDSNEPPFDIISPLTKRTKGIGPRVTFSLGYAF